MSDEITAAELEGRLVSICLGGPLTGLPRRDRDKAILLASATLWMDPDTVYSEAEVNGRLRSWLSEVCPSLGLDFVTLRRELVDRNYLDRDDSGRHYAPGRGPVSWRFADDVGGLDPCETVNRAVAEKAERKRAYLERDRDPSAG